MLTLRVHGRLARELLKHLRRARKPVTRLSDGAVEYQLVDLEVLHRVRLQFRLSCEQQDRERRKGHESP